jgi:hypothetical protein
LDCERWKDGEKKRNKKRNKKGKGKRGLRVA